MPPEPFGPARAHHTNGRAITRVIYACPATRHKSRRVDIAGNTVHPDERWMRRIARNVTMEGCGALRDCRYLLHDRDTKYTQSFRAIIASGQVEPLVLPARGPEIAEARHELDRSME